MASFDRTIPPGGEGKITLSVDTEGYHGNIRKTATVYTNDPETAGVTLVIRALVRVPIFVRPSYAQLYGKRDATIKDSVEITAGLDKPLQLQPNRFSLEGRVNYRIEEIEEGRKFIVYFMNIPGSAGFYRGFLNLKTNYDEKPTVTIMINVRIKN